jgi:CheY-like chemotaxis protein
MQNESAAGRTKVLYVEDDPACMLLVHRLLESEGFQVVTTSDGLSATEFAMYEKPDLILMDINIGGLDGYEVTTESGLWPRGAMGTSPSPSTWIPFPIRCASS